MKQPPSHPSHHEGPPKGTCFSRLPVAAPSHQDQEAIVIVTKS